MLLEEIVRRKRTAFFRDALNWKDAIQKSCLPLVQTGCATSEYARRIIECVEELGPYIVIVPGLAIPHSTKGCPEALKTAISFVHFEVPVIFDPEDRQKDVRIFFALSAVNEDEHIKNMRRLFKILSNDETLGKLMEARSSQDLLSLDERYLKG